MRITAAGEGFLRLPERRLANNRGIVADDRLADGLSLVAAGDDLRGLEYADDPGRPQDRRHTGVVPPVLSSEGRYAAPVQRVGDEPPAVSRDAQREDLFDN